jgi:hypothetical protein
MPALLAMGAESEGRCSMDSSGWEEHEIKVTIKIRVPATPEAWELYDEPGADRAALELTGTLLKALQAETAKEAADIMLKKMDSIDGFGASDTEPRANATKVLRQVFGKEFCL